MTNRPIIRRTAESAYQRVLSIVATETEHGRALPCAVDPELFFRDPHTPDVAIATALCVGCPARLPCAEFAIANDEQWGVWGGQHRSQATRSRRAAKDTTRQALRRSA